MPVKGDELCVVCETVMGELKSILDDPNNKKTIEQILDEVCNFVPASDKGLVSAVLLTFVKGRGIFRKGKVFGSGGDYCSCWLDVICSVIM